MERKKYTWKKEDKHCGVMLCKHFDMWKCIRSSGMCSNGTSSRAYYDPKYKD